jgi:hypothetical protein
MEREIWRKKYGERSSNVGRKENQLLREERKGTS